ncbi:acyl-CoA thioesterase [Cecembia calidifontis]|jgi:acyl-CoA thioester hydrolase|uniref:Acyl-CoA thioester hydrolase n=1 Tax=Cecembia calidifontis TaxID=1187080 RepID=A0A4V2F762_9BACT|nr:thioesterase family protein [Cecembia calidifontis]RZS98709.1 acyl-CoA thioester hydrolase [Cecembia calidifontis]
MQKYTIEDVKSSFSFSVPIQIRFSDIDGYMHVNNGIYFSYFEHARAAYLYKVCGWDIMKTGTVVANINIDYKVPLHIMDQPSVYIRCSHIGNTSFVLEQVLMGPTDKGDVKIFAQASVTMVSVDMKTMRPVAVPQEYASKMSEKSI